MISRKSITVGLRHKGVIGMILLLWPVCAFAQHKQTDVVYLKNGSIIYGSLSPAKDSNHIALETEDNGVWVFPRSAVIKSGRGKTVFPQKKKGFYNTTSAGLFFGDNKGYEIESIIGYHFGYRYYAGGGAAIDDYTFRAIPVFASFCADLFLKKTTPFLYANTGFANPWPRSGTTIGNAKVDRKRAGLYLDAGVGQKLRVDFNHSLQLSLGYSLEKIKLLTKQINGYDPFTQRDLYKTDTYEYSFNRLVLKAGFTL